MTIILKDKVLANFEHISVNPPNSTPTPEILAKRAAREANRTKYTVIRKKLTPEAKATMKLFVNGEEIPLSDSVKYLIGELISSKQV